MDPVDELKQLEGSVDAAIKLTQDQLNNIGIAPPLPVSLASLASLGAAIGLTVVFKVLLVWVPTSFILWMLWSIWGIVRLVLQAMSTNPSVLFGRYRKLTNKRKRLGAETILRLLTSMAIAAAVPYFISAIILVSAKAGVVDSPSGFSIWLPLAADVLLIAYILATPVAYRIVKVSDINRLVSLHKSGKLEDFIRRRLVLVVIAVVAILAAAAFIQFGLPLWSLIASWGLYDTGANGFKIVLVLILQIMSFLLMLGYATHLDARRELCNSSASLSNIQLRVKQLQGSGEISLDEVSHLKKEYYRSIKYRFVQGRMLGFIAVYSPVLNEAYVEANGN